MFIVSADTLQGIYEGRPNFGHLGGIAAGFLIGLTELHLRGPSRAMFIFMWTLITLVWIRISTNLEEGGMILTPTSDRNVTDSLDIS